MATNPLFRAAQGLGWTPAGPTVTAFIQLNAAANWFALSFTPVAALTLSEISAFVSAVAGTLAGSDVTCDLYDSTGTSGAPGSSIEAGTLPTATITAAGWYRFTGFTTALTAGTKYWAVFKNVNGVPATNNPTFGGVGLGAIMPTLGGGNSRFGWAWSTSTNSGSTWSTATSQTGVRVGYSDGSYDGMPISSPAPATITDGIYATHESGMKFTTPANGVLNVRGVAFFLAAQTGTPTNAFKFGIWTGSTPANQGYTKTIAQANQAAAGWYYASFASDIVIQPGTVVRATIATSGADASSKRYNVQEIKWDSDSDSLALTPFEGTCVKTYYDGANWTDTAGSMFAFALLLNTTGEFGPGAGGGPVGGIINVGSAVGTSTW